MWEGKAVKWSLCVHLKEMFGNIKQKVLNVCTRNVQVVGHTFSIEKTWKWKMKANRVVAWKGFEEINTAIKTEIKK